jgi:hypothetical protein
VGFGFEGLSGFGFVGLGLEGLGFPLVLEPLVYSRAPFDFNKLLFIKKKKLPLKLRQRCFT